MAEQIGTVGTYNSVGIADGTAGTHVCVTTTNGNVFHTIRAAGGSWQIWGDVKLATNTSAAKAFKKVDCAVNRVIVGQTAPPPGLISTPIYGDELHLVALTTDGTPYHAIRQPNGGGSELLSVNVPTGNSAAFLDVDIDVDASSNLHVIGTGSNLQSHSMRFPGGGWSVFGNVEVPAGDPGIQQSGAAVAIEEGLYVFDRLSNGGIMMTRRDSGGGWDTFSNLRTATGSSESFAKVSAAGLSGVDLPE